MVPDLIRKSWIVLCFGGHRRSRDIAARIVVVGLIGDLIEGLLNFRMNLSMGTFRGNGDSQTVVFTEGFILGMDPPVHINMNAHVGIQFILGLIC
jgi:hypothetical protein